LRCARHDPRFEWSHRGEGLEGHERRCFQHDASAIVQFALQQIHIQEGAQVVIMLHGHIEAVPHLNRDDWRAGDLRVRMRNRRPRAGAVVAKIRITPAPSARRAR
jgi:hypothetical protein